MSVASILADSADRFADHVAVRCLGVDTTYAELWLVARSWAAVLAEKGIGPGDAVAILIPNTTDFPRAYYAILSLGAVVVPVHALLRAEEIAYVLGDSGAKMLVAAGPLLGEGAKGAELAGVPVLGVMAGADAGVELLDELAKTREPVADWLPRRPDDTAVILYTSGTTGQPKGAEITHLNIVMNVDTGLISSFDISTADTVLGCLPLFHTFGQTCTMNTGFRAGARIVFMPRFDGATALQLLVEEECTIFQGVPTMYMALLAAAKATDVRPQHLKYTMSGGAALPLTVLESMQTVFGVEVLEGYGLTETAPVATFNQKGRTPRPGTVGRAIWGVQVAIADPLSDTIDMLPTGELGEIVIRGHNIMKGYLNKPEATAKAIVDGWFRSGDLGTKDADGYVTIVDRTKDMIIRGGYNVYPREVEESLLRHPSVDQVAVIGVPHETHGEEVCAVVIPSDPGAFDGAELVAWAKTKLAGHKYPRRVEVVEVFPLGPSGKVLKRELAARFRDA